jgi:hypothetical protein
MEDLSTPEQRLKYASMLSRNKARGPSKTSLSHYQETPSLKVSSILLRPPSPPPASTLLKRLTGAKADASTEPLDAYNRHFQEGMALQSKGDVFPFKNEVIATQSKALPLLSGSASAKRERIRIGAIDEIRSLRLNFNEASTIKVKNVDDMV